MAAAIDQLPVTSIVEPADPAGLAETLRAAFDAGVATYPLGGRTSLAFGLPAKTSGQGVSTARLARVVDYPARDLTITVEAGVTMATLAATLAAENQELPLDVPRADAATIGGVVATNWNGPRRFGCGTVRDHVIGIGAVDGRGVAFKGGGRVVKNVAGYDFCKLLTGSFGSLAVVSQVTLKLRPRCETSVLAIAPCADLAQAEALLANLVLSETRPAAVELAVGPAWRTLLAGAGESCAVIARLDGTRPEVAWMRDKLAEEFRSAGVRTDFDEHATDGPLWRQIVDFPALDDGAPLVIKANVAPSGVASFVRAVRRIDPAASLLSHAGNGIVFARFSKFPDGGLTRSLLAVLQPAAAAAHGKVVVLSNPSGAEATRQSAWGGLDAPGELMASVKRQFDPKNLLNPGRFVFA